MMFVVIFLPDGQVSWNNDTRVPTHDFDEWLQLQNEDERPPQKVQKYRGGKINGCTGTSGTGGIF